MSNASVPFPAPNSYIVMFSSVSKLLIRLSNKKAIRYPNKGCVRGDVA